MAYARLEPFGERRADLRAAIVACMLANIHRDRDIHPEPFEVSEFMPDFGDGEIEDEEPSVDALRVFIEQLNAALGGKDLREQ
jgi:hypothetical protein